MTGINLDRLRERGNEFAGRISQEHYLAHAGLAPAVQLQQVYAEYSDVYSERTLEMVREHFANSPPNTDEHRSARTLLEWVVDTRAGQSAAALDEREVAWEGAAFVTTSEGREVAYSRVAIEIGNERDRAQRLELDDARARLVGRELAPLKLERLQREKEMVESLEIAKDYNSTFTALSGVDVLAESALCEQFLRDTQAMWDDVLPPVLRRTLGITREQAMRSDAQALRRLAGFDDAFPAGAMEVVVRGQLKAMGIDPDAGGRIRYDIGERAGKRSRAFCAPVRIPDEVHLVLRPHGGQGDWRTLLHELGHALHFAHAGAELPFEFRWLGDNSVTEGYAMLFDHLMQDAHWLRRYASGLGARTRSFEQAMAFEELHFLRRYCAKLVYEVQLYGGGVPWRALPDLYVETLTAATGFRYQPADAFVDVDPRFYSVRYLRAWKLQAVLSDALRVRFNEDWFRNPAAGPWLTQELFSAGQRELADELAQRVAGQTLSFAPVISAIEESLA